MTALDTGQRVKTAPVGPAGRRPPGHPGERQRPRRKPADPVCLSRWFAALFLEVEAGQRPRAHLEPLMDPRLAVRLAPVWVRPGPLGRILSVSVHGVPGHDVPGHGLYDTVVIVRRGPRVGALCLRLAQTVSGWRVQEAARPEDGRLPQPALGDQVDEPNRVVLAEGAA
ncbi:MAG: Rv3235 family protein [Pseudonocardiaceae bacterium]